MFDLHGRNAVVTGASAGLGREIALALAGQGANVAILARRENKLEEVAQEIRALGVDCLVVKCDVTVTAEVMEAAEKCIKYFGKIDILVNNAGGGHQIDAATGEIDEWFRIADLNLNSVYRCCRAFGQHMIGSITVMAASSILLPCTVLSVAGVPKILPMLQQRAALSTSHVLSAPSGRAMVLTSMRSAPVILKPKLLAACGSL